MNAERKLTDRESWLAAEYALGVLGQADMKRAEKLYDNDRAFRECVNGWQHQLEPLLDEVDDVTPPLTVWNRVRANVFPPIAERRSEGGAGFWKLITAFSSTVAVGCFALLMYSTGGDFTGSKAASLQEQLASAISAEQNSRSELASIRDEVTGLESQLAELSSASGADKEALEQARDALASAEAEIASVQEQLAASQSELSAVLANIEDSQPLVASLTQSGDAPAFVAQYDPLKKALLIRTTVEDTDEKVPEIWLIPDQGDRKGEVLSLGVMDEAAPDTVKITEDFLPLIGEGGTLAITMEPPGGAPNGVATGPVIALGKLQAL